MSDVLPMEGETEKLRGGESGGPEQSLQVDEDGISDDTTCGYGPFRGPCLQRLATKNVYVFLYGVLGIINSASWAYFNGTINTMEKRFKIPSRTLGLMNVGTNASQLFMSTVLSYWAGRSHRPRWIAFSMVCGVLQMMLYVLPHLIYGAGPDALQLTEEFGGTGNKTYDAIENEKKDLCRGGESCTEAQGSFIQPAILFVARFVGGIGGGLFYTAGISYIDDNTKKSESPFLVSLAYFLRMLGPSVGYALASVCLKVYIEPFLTPTITADDPRWLGAWWLGWIGLIILSSISIFPMCLFPKVLPETAAKRAAVETVSTENPPPSVRDLFVTTKRLLSNKLYLFNSLASFMYVLGDTPYFTYLTKYIETQYRQNASKSNFITGTVGLITSAGGILLAGYVIGKVRPSARSLAGWNVFVGALTVCGCISYIFIDCGSQVTTQPSYGFNSTLQCNVLCDCEHTPYAPVCSQDNETFISACHAGCLHQETRGESKVYTDCLCVDGGAGTATPGLCPTDCTGPLSTFLIVLSILNFVGFSGVPSNFLVGIRCVDEKDKSAAMGLSLTMLGIFAFAPAPVLYGYILDATCIVWGKTCEGTGNCWLYDGPQLAYKLNLTAAFFIAIGTAFDAAVWYNAKNLKIFD